jgi:murein peptide amidase A
MGQSQQVRLWRSWIPLARSHEGPVPCADIDLRILRKEARRRALPHRSSVRLTEWGTVRFASLTFVFSLVVLLPVSGAGAEVDRFRIGRSVKGRPIRVVERGDFSSRNEIVVVGCIHGNECAGTAVVRRLRRTRLVDGLDLFLIKTVNPDGRKAGTRQNGRGVDLNRNFGYHWKAIGERWDTYYSGPRPWSEPETRAVRDFVLDVKPRVTIWYHQALSLVTKLGGPRDRRIERRYARRVGLPLRRLKRPGVATRWQNHRLRRTTAFVVELPGGGMSKSEVRRHTRAVKEIARTIR